MTNPDLKQSFHHLRLSIPLLVLRIIVAFLVVELGFGLVLAFGTVLVPVEIGPVPQWVVALVKSLVELVVILKLVLDWAAVVYYVRDHQLVRFKGIFELSESVWELRSLKTVKLHQNWLGNLLNFGDIAVTFSSSGYREDIVLRGIARARECEHVFHEFLAEATARTRRSDEEVPAVPSQP